MTPQQLYKDIEPVLMAFRLSGMKIMCDRIGDSSVGKNVIIFSIRFDQFEPIFCYLTISARDVIVCLDKRFRCSFSDVPRFVAEELMAFNGLKTA